MAQRGTIDKRPSGQYRARFTLPDGRRASKSFTTKTAAKSWLAESIVDAQRGDLPDKVKGATTFGEYADRWLATRLNVRASTLETDRALVAHAVRDLGALPVSQITPDHVRAVIRGAVDRGLAPSTVRHIKRVTAAVLDMAVEDRACPRNVARSKTVKTPKVEREEMTILTPAEVSALADAVGERYGALVVVAADTGARFGELAGLKVEDIQTLRRQITVRRQRLRNGETAPVKTDAGGRTIDVDASTIETLAAHLAKYPSASGFIFTGPEGGPLNYGNFRKRVWNPAVESIGHPGLKFHQLRHTNAAHLIAAGVHPKTIQTRLGHSSIRVTMDTYGHLAEGVGADAAERLRAYREGIA